MTPINKRSSLWVLLGALLAAVFFNLVQAQGLLANGRGLESVKLRFVNITAAMAKREQDDTYKKLNEVTLKLGEPVKITFDRFVTDLKPFHQVSGWLKLELKHDNRGNPAIFYELDLDISYKENDGGLKTYNDKSDYSEARKVAENTYWGGSNQQTFSFWVEVVDVIHAEVTTDADEDAGETGILIPAAIAGILIGGGAAAAWSRNRRKKEPRKEEKKEEDNPNRYEMRIRKDFGNTLVIGRKVPIYARMVEISPEGHETSRHDLTAKISISSPDGLHISGESMAGDYKAAHVEVPASATIPAEARVSFCFKSDGGSFTNHVVFQIEEEKIVFAQDNLTLPACHEKTERLPFAVLGMGKEALVTASIIRDDGYSVTVEAADQPGLYYAVITEKKKTVGQAGDYDSYTLEVKAVNGEHSITGTLPIYRFNMGLRLDISPVSCYVEPYDSHKHCSNKFLFTVAGQQYVPAETKAMVSIFDWDFQSHSLLHIAPDNLDFQVQALQDTDQPLLEKLAIQCQILDEVTGGGRALVFRCCKGALDAPTRFKVKLSITVTQGEKKHTVQQEVLLCSQPLRQSKDTADAMAMLKADASMTERLQRIRSQIWEMNFLNNLFPLVKFIDVMLDGYHEAYGYDARQIEIVQQTWGGFLQGTVAGANAQAQTVTFGDEVKLYIESYLQTAESVEQSLGFMGRMALGVTTLGCSDVVFTSLDVARDMKAYVDSGGDSEWGAFYVGVKVVALEVLSDKAMGAGLGKLKKVANNPNVKRAVREIKESAADNVVRFTTALRGKNAQAAIADSVNAGKKAVGQAKLMLETGQRIRRKTARQLELDDALHAGKEFAQEQVSNLQAAAWQFELNPTPANRKLMNEMAIKVQQNKLAMYALQDYADEGLDSVRKSLNETLTTFYQRADTLATDRLSSMSGIPSGKIQIMNASSSSQEMMKRGKKSTIDRDWTAFYINSKGEYVYFDQRLTEQVYNDSFFEVSTGFKSKDADFSNRYGLKTDQTVIEDILGHAESYGTDLKKMLDKTRFDAALDNPDKVALTVANKGKEWFERATRLFDKAETISDVADRQLMLAEAISQRMEGYRQLIKQFDNCINPRDVARRSSAEASQIPERLRVSIEMARRQFEIRSPFALTDIENSLESLGFTPEGFADALGEAVRQIG